MSRFVHNIHGLCKEQEDGSFLSWRGGSNRAKSVPATEAHFSSALTNAERGRYTPAQVALVRQWYDEWRAA